MGNQKKTLAEIRKLGIQVGYKPDTKEYRLNHAQGTEATAAYTDSAEDAIATAKAIAEWAKKQGVFEKAKRVVKKVARKIP